MTTRISYLHHSGFLVSHGEHHLIFDCITPNSPLVQQALDSGQKVLVFASHSHPDHFDWHVADWQRDGQVELIFGRDIFKRYPAHFMKSMERLSVLGAQISAYPSTDKGVSFYVSLPGLDVFHAGDLNDWHFRDVASNADADAAHQKYLRALVQLPKSADIAMFPVDPRLGSDHDLGARLLIAHMHPRLLIPMHWWEQKDVPRTFAKQTFEGTQIVALTERDQQMQYEFDSP
ncbi:MBL fold metallo-hydrolase [Eubacteriales bacterium OttesenSCG-928-N13]|nr:MBL fold metallo-hydrolase [Eubacteriales bacterium OttesenSCG-928-N13]